VGGTGSEKIDDARQRNFVLAMKLRNGQGQRGFEPRNAEGGALKLDLLFVRGVRSVVGGDGVYGAIGERNQNGFAIRGRTQGRVHLEIRVVLAHVLVEQSEMMRRHFAGNARLGALATAHGLERIGSGKMRDVQARFTNLLCESHVAIHDAGFSRR